MFDRKSLEDAGFVGFVPLPTVRRTAGIVPRCPGVYAVLLVPEVGAFRERSVGGHFKGRNPTVARSVLEKKFNHGVEVQYLGRTESSLAERLDTLRRFGQGEAVGHWGGRYLWQLEACGDLLVAWRVESDAVSAEAELIDEFVRVVGQLPFANLVRGRRLVATA